MPMLTSSSETDSATCVGYLRKKARTPSRLSGLTRGCAGSDCVIQSADGSVVSRRESFSQSRPFATKIFTRRPPALTLGEMNASELTVRRATVDDLNGLKQLWERARLQVLDLERRLTEFQLLVSNESDLLGAIDCTSKAKRANSTAKRSCNRTRNDRFARN